MIKNILSKITSKFLHLSLMIIFCIYAFILLLVSVGIIAVLSLVLTKAEIIPPGFYQKPVKIIVCLFVLSFLISLFSILLGSRAPIKCSYRLFSSYGIHLNRNITLNKSPSTVNSNFPF